MSADNIRLTVDRVPAGWQVRAASLSVRALRQFDETSSDGHSNMSLPNGPVPMAYFCGSCPWHVRHGGISPSRFALLNDYDMLALLRLADAMNARITNNTLSFEDKYEVSAAALAEFKQLLEAL
jgi:hypothetical protein